MPNKRLLLLSNSTNPAERFLEHAEDIIKDFLHEKIKRVLFIPFARVLPTFDDFASIVRKSFESMGYKLDSVHETNDQIDAVMTAEAIIVGGGNTFHLLYYLYETGLLESIRSCVNEGVPYIGWSAGSNIACPTIKTTNDMPIKEPRTFNALGLVPFQINPHYTDLYPVGNQTETRAERILEFIEVNPAMYVVGLRNGSMLKIEGSTIELLGSEDACIFIKGKPPTNYSTKDSVQFLLDQRISQKDGFS